MNVFTRSLVEIVASRWQGYELTNEHLNLEISLMNSARTQVSLMAWFK